MKQGQGKRKIREELFARFYVTDPELNGAEAARKAGYAPRSAKVTASRLLTKANVKALIADLTKRQSDALDLKAEKVLRELALMGFANMLDYIAVQEDGMVAVDLSKITRAQAAAIQEITTEEYTVEGDDKKEAKVVTKTRFKLADKLRCLELLGKYLKLFTEKMELTGAGGAPLDPPSLTVVFLPKPDRSEMIGSTPEPTPIEVKPAQIEAPELALGV
jgi:phage terminase small subunit